MNNHLNANSELIIIFSLTFGSFELTLHRN